MSQRQQALRPVSKGETVEPDPARFAVSQPMQGGAEGAHRDRGPGNIRLSPLHPNAEAAPSESITPLGSSTGEIDSGAECDPGTDFATIEGHSREGGGALTRLSRLMNDLESQILLWQEVGSRKSGTIGNLLYASSVP